MSDNDDSMRELGEIIAKLISNAFQATPDQGQDEFTEMVNALGSDDDTRQAEAEMFFANQLADPLNRVILNTATISDAHNLGQALILLLGRKYAATALRIVADEVESGDNPTWGRMQTIHNLAREMSVDHGA